MPVVEITVSEAPRLTRKASLPDHRSSWPKNAVSAYWDLLGELNDWCRECDQPFTSNAWIAETAVRQAW